ncbi:MAG TPA: hypothetical protein VKU38_00770 [Ktedonobacteraceae bacterium]|nr:hypothetical protein [Ktedonobacteraceae bacterium]
MLDHDELLPEELANPFLIEELRATYHLTPDEQRVLARVHERLAQYAYALPVNEDEDEQAHEYEPVSAAYDSRPLQLVSPIPTLEKPVRTRQRWSRRLNAIAGVIFLVLLVGSLVLTFSVGHRTTTGSVGLHPSGGSEMRILLVPAETSSMYSQQEMQTEATILSHRFSNFGLHGSSVRVQMIRGELGLVVDLPHFGNNEQQTINTLLQVGVLDFWNTGPSSNENAILPSDILFKPNQYIQYNPGGQPRFTSLDYDPASFSVASDSQTGRPQINGQMKGSAIGRFGAFTRMYINYGLTITLDGKVLSSANIQSPINGQFVITGNFTQQQAQALVAVLKYAPLPFALKVVS